MPAKNGFQLQDTDLALLRVAHELRLARVDHFTALTGRSEIALWRRLRKLREHRYLASVSRLFQHHIYAIGSEGIAAIIEAGFAPRELAEKRLRHRELSEIGIRHALHLSDVHARMMLITRNTPIAIDEWSEGQRHWNTVRHPESSVLMPVRPDALCVLRHTGRPEERNKFYIFVEADRSTMSRTKMLTKLDAYLEYYRQGLHLRKYPRMNAFMVATITQTRARADALRKDLHPSIPHAAWREAYPFIAIQDLTLKALLPRAAGATIDDCRREVIVKSESSSTASL